MVLTTKNLYTSEPEKDVNQKRCSVSMSQLLKTLEECCIFDQVKDAFIVLQKEIKKANEAKS